MKKWFVKKFLFLLLLLLTVFEITGCGQQKESTGKKIQVYYLSNTETKVESHEYVLQSTSLRQQLEELFQCMGTMPERLEYKAPLALNFALKQYELEDGKLILDMDLKYKELSPTTEVLIRAAFVNTLTQLSEVNFVGFTVEGSPLEDSLGNLVGMMSADQFINNEGSEINTIETAHLKLYFANKNGDKLIAVNRTKNYSSNVPLEKLVVQQIIAGPDSELADMVFPVTNPNTQVISTTVTDGVCYVNLDDSFLNQMYNVTADVAIYAIVNSLAELTDVNKVQISINGNTSGTFREKYSFSTIYERNLDLVTTIDNENNH